MSKLVYIKPAKTSSKFWHNPEIKGYQHFPETQKAYPPYWDFNEHKYKFYGLDDDEVITLAKSCKLSSVEGDNEGLLIQDIDLHHKEGEFFNHPKMQVKIKDDVTTFNLNDPLDKLKLAAIKSYPFVAHSENDKKRIAGAKWVIIDEEIEQKNAEKEFIHKMEINKYFVPGKDKIAPERMRTILAAFNDPNIRMDANTGIDTVSAWLYEKANDKAITGGMSNQDRFFMLVRMKDDELNIRALIQKSVKAGALRVKSGKYFYAGNEIAHNMESLVKKLVAPENQSLLNAIEEEINFKSNV